MAQPLAGAPIFALAMAFVLKANAFVWRILPVMIALVHCRAQRPTGLHVQVVVTASKARASVLQGGLALHATNHPQHCQQIAPSTTTAPAEELVWTESASASQVGLENSACWMCTAQRIAAATVCVLMDVASVHQDSPARIAVRLPNQLVWPQAALMIALDTEFAQTRATEFLLVSAPKDGVAKPVSSKAFAPTSAPFMGFASTAFAYAQLDSQELIARLQFM